MPPPSSMIFYVDFSSFVTCTEMSLEEHHLGKTKWPIFFPIFGKKIGMLFSPCQTQNVRQKWVCKFFFDNSNWFLKREKQ